MNSREIATTNNTLNAFVGGKQRSWMTNPSVPVNPGIATNVQTKPRKRSIVCRQLDSTVATGPESSQPIDFASTNRLSGKSSHSSTDRPEGEGAGERLSGRGASEGGSSEGRIEGGDIQVLPSPAPSEGRPSPTVNLPSILETENRIEINSTPIAVTSPLREPECSNNSSATANESSEASVRHEVVESGLTPSHFIKPNARSTETSDDNTSKRRKINGIFEATTGTQIFTHPLPLTPVTSPGIPNKPVHRHSISSNSSGLTSGASVSTTSQDAVHRQVQSPPRNISASRQSQQSSPLSLSRPLNFLYPVLVHPPALQSAPILQPPPSRVRPHPGNLVLGNHQTPVVRSTHSPTTSRVITSNTSPAAPTCSPIQTHPPRLSNGNIMDFITKAGGNQALLPAEKVRVEWLFHALHGGDLGFLTLHQLYCLSATARHYLESSTILLPDVFRGFDFFGKLLCDNGQVSESFLEFFSSFPDSIQTLMMQPQYITIVRDLQTFLRQGPPTFTNILNRCLRRRTSPTAEELVIQPFTCSVVLQRLIWRRIRIALDKGVETSSGAELERQFIAQQFEILRNRGLIPPSQVTQDHQWWLAQQQQAQIIANQHTIQHKIPELTRPQHPGFMYPVPLASTIQQHPALPIHSGSRQQHSQQHHKLVSPVQDTFQHTNSVANFVPRQGFVQTEQLISQVLQGPQPNQAQVVVSPTSQHTPVGQSPLASTVQTPRLPGNFCQTSMLRSPNMATTTPLSVRQPVPNPLVTTPSSAEPLSRRTSISPREHFVDHYISVIAFATQDCSLPGSFPFIAREFILTQELSSRLSVWEPHQYMPGRHKRTVQDRSLIYRLRCVQAVKGKDDITQTANWVLRETSWPPHIFIQLNNQPIQLRRKHIFNADLFVDITNQVNIGTNVLKVAMFPEKDKPIPIGTYILRVEILEARSHAAIANQIALKQTIDQESAKATIISRLKPSEDDDVVVELNQLTLSIVCPFTMQLITTPVRGRLCLHTECFDLDNYLASRPRKKPREPPDADTWKCPYCNGDARPLELVVDGFIMDVVTQVRLMRNMLVGEMREVVVKKDGSWELKKEDAAKGKGPNRAPSMAKESIKEMEVITIDDDD